MSRVDVRLDFSDVADDAKMLVGLLESTGGDVEMFAKLFNIDDPMLVLSRTLLTLNDAANLAWRFKWDSLIAAFKEAKVALAERKAIDLIANHSPTAATTAEVLALARFWMADHSAGQTTRARKNANQAAPRGELAELESIADELGDEDEE